MAARLRSCGLLLTYGPAGAVVSVVVVSGGVVSVVVVSGGIVSVVVVSGGVVSVVVVVGGGAVVVVVVVVVVVGGGKNGIPGMITSSVVVVVVGGGGAVTVVRVVCLPEVSRPPVEVLLPLDEPEVDDEPPALTLCAAVRTVGPVVPPRDWVDLVALRVVVVWWAGGLVVVEGGGGRATTATVDGVVVVLGLPVVGVLAGLVVVVAAWNPSERTTRVLGWSR
jgi:hypothetical protein